MKELSIEEKAKRYDEALDNAKVIYKTIRKDLKPVIEQIFPELKESEDERIIGRIKTAVVNYWSDEPLDEILAWLEKQGEQDNNEDEAILHRFSFYSYKDEPNILYLAGLYVNDKYRNKGIGTKILEVADEVAKSLNCHAIRLKTKKDSNAERLYKKHGYNSLVIEGKDKIWLEKQGEQNPAWNEEDEKMLNKCIEYASNIVPVKATEGSGLFVDFERVPDEKVRDWLKALKERYTWKPSDEQINTLWDAIVYVEGCNSNFKGNGSVLEKLYNDLKKLRVKL